MQARGVAPTSNACQPEGVRTAACEANEAYEINRIRIQTQINKDNHIENIRITLIINMHINKNIRSMNENKNKNGDSKNKSNSKKNNNQ